MFREAQRKGSQVFENAEEYEKFRKEWNEMRRLFLNIEWVKEYRKGVKVVNL